MLICTLSCKQNQKPLNKDELNDSKKKIVRVNKYLVKKDAEVIESYIRSKMAYSRTHPKASKIFALELINGAQNIHDAIHLPMVNWTSGKVTIIQSWVDKGLIRRIDPLYLLFLIWGTTQFYADCDAEIHMIKQRALTDQEFEQATQFVIDTVLKGLDLG